MGEDRNVSPKNDKRNQRSDRRDKSTDRVFVVEQGFHDEFDKIDQSAIHFLLYDGKKAIATARVYEGIGYKL